MNNNIFTAQNEQFYIDCEVIETKYEYPQYTGVEKWIIITDLTEEELNSRYAEQIAPLRPFIILARSFGEVRNDFRRNEKKHHMRAVRSCSIYDFSEETENYHPEIVTYSLEDEILMNEEEQLLAQKMELVQAAISQLKPIQRDRLVKFFFDGKSMREIADEEGVNHSAVSKSINAAIKKVKKFFEKGVHSTSLSGNK
mgnify:CR=1 FL=1